MARINEVMGQVSWGRAIKNFFSGYFDFKGRTTRAGYWWIMLSLFLLNLISIPFGIKLFLDLMELIIQETTANEALNALTKDLFVYMIVIGIIALILFIPSVALLVRRFRDVGLRGRGFLIIWGVIILSNVINLISTGNQLTPPYTYSNGIDVFISSIDMVLNIFLFVLTLLPADAITIRSKNVFLLIFLREKIETK